MLRKNAAQTLLDKKSILDTRSSELADIEPVLDFLEDLGFYEYGGQMSAEAIHHHFYHWVHGYWQASQRYVTAWRSIEPARWEHLEKLEETLEEIEVEKTKRKYRGRLSDDELAEFLREEIKTWELISGKPS